MVILSICLEEVPGRTTRCVAVPGRQPGLRLDAAGEIRWQDGGGFELWTSADERLVLYRAAGAPPLRLHRAARVLDVPAEKPVILVGGDELELGRRRYRVHLHGVAAAVAAPEPFVPAPPARDQRALGRAAAAVLGAALAGCPGPGTPGVTPPSPIPPDAGASASPDAAPVTPPIEIRDQPPAPPLPPEERTGPPPPLVK